MVATFINTEPAESELLNPRAGSSDIGLLAGFVDVLASVTVSGLAEAELAEVLTAVSRVKRAAAGLQYRVGAEADRLAALGKSAPAGDMMGQGGKSRGSTARRDAARSKTVGETPGLGDAAGSGEVGTDQIDSLTRRLKDLTDEERSRLDFDKLVAKAKTLPADRFDKVLREAVEQARNDHGLQEHKQNRKTSEFRHWFDHKAGIGRFSGRLDALRYEALATAIEQHVNTLAATESQPKDAELAARSLVDLVTSSGGRSQNLPHVTVVVDTDTLATGVHDNSIRETGNGHSLPPETLQRLCCDAVLQRVVLDQTGVPINVGRKYRTATDAQWTAIRSIYSTCGWDSCDRPLSWCQLHHVNYWRNGGKTNLDNLIPLCNSHHHRVHEGGWTLTLKPDRSFDVLRPDETYHSTVPPPTRKIERQ